MKDNFQKSSPGNKTFVYLAGATFLVMALALSMVIQPVMASPAAQDATATVTATVGDVGTPALTPTVSGTGTVVATATVAATATRAATLAPPGTTGTPTALVPVTGADLTPPGEQSRMAVRIGLALLGLLLIGFGLRSYRTGKR